MTTELNIFRSLEFIKDKAPHYAKSKADRVYLDEFKKTKLALCMKAAEARGINTISGQEREAYADPNYQVVLEGLREAVEKEETLRWQIVSAQAAIEVWRTMESTKRAEARNL